MRLGSNSLAVGNLEEALGQDQSSVRRNFSVEYVRPNLVTCLNLEKTGDNAMKRAQVVVNRLRYLAATRLAWTDGFLLSHVVLAFAQTRMIRASCSCAREMYQA